MRKPSGSPRPEFIDNDALREIRSNADWKRAFDALGLVKAPGKGNADDWWAKSPFNPDERTPSFHMSSSPDGSGRWYCHSTHQGGGLLELVQEMNGSNIYEAGRWLLDHQCSYRSGSPAPFKVDTAAPVQAVLGENARSEKGSSSQIAENRPIRQSLLPLLTQQGTHPEFQRRGLSEATCRYLGLGYLPENSKSSLKGRLVFQVRGVLETAGNAMAPSILTHIGRATTQEQIDGAGKWMFYKGFHKTRELYNLDQALLDPEAIAQAKDTGRILLVEGPFDVAQCIEAGLRNVVGAFGSDLSERQLPRLELLRERLGVDEIVVWFDRDKAGQVGQAGAFSTLKGADFKARAFAWDQSFPSSNGDVVPIPETLTDPGEFAVNQLQWLRAKGVI